MESWPIWKGIEKNRVRDRELNAAFALLAEDLGFQYRQMRKVQKLFLKHWTFSA